jgi:hypothetical protein
MVTGYERSPPAEFRNTFPRLPEAGFTRIDLQLELVHGHIGQQPELPHVRI